MADSFTRLIVFAVGFAAVMAIWGFIYTKRTGKPFIVIDSGKPKSPPPVATGEPVTVDLIQGRWRMIECGKNGKFAPIFELALSNFVMEISGDRFTLAGSNEGGRLQIDGSSFPTVMDQICDDGDIHRCIARLVDGQLEICQGDANKPRPADFSRSRKDDATLTRFSRSTNKAS
jgi:uncharacterized protein (TIGR03067 family)